MRCSRQGYLFDASFEKLAYLLSTDEGEVQGKKSWARSNIRRRMPLQWVIICSPIALAIFSTLWHTPSEFKAQWNRYKIRVDRVDNDRSEHHTLYSTNRGMRSWFCTRLYSVHFINCRYHIFSSQNILQSATFSRSCFSFVYVSYVNRLAVFKAISTYNSRVQIKLGEDTVLVICTDNRYLVCIQNNVWSLLITWMCTFSSPQMYKFFTLLLTEKKCQEFWFFNYLWMSLSTMLLHFAIK